MNVTLRKSGGATVASLPSALLNVLELGVGSKLQVTLVDGGLLLKPVVVAETLEALLKNDTLECYQMTEEDNQFLGMKSLGNEF